MIRTPVRRTRRRVALPLALLTATGIALSGCGSVPTVPAAVVDGEVISDSDVQALATEINEGMGETLPEPMTGQQALFPLIVAPAVEEVTQRHGAAISDDQARQVLADMEDPSPLALRYIKTAMALQGVGPEVTQEIVSEVQAADIEVSPRYGEWDPEMLTLTNPVPNWIRDDTAEQGEPTP